ncbi:cytochrome b/b6 domain-containing protein [Mesorhizobium sp.]|jgi:cytochrome b|uniref:cytochrome b/b6 domain-containing protein n=1 Tax=Mesorhizobium sp. TaxID=1871066 RepID=UPI000FE32D24|nr:cytochrome b/b6 domain-containing protein [Mesorhizobium sp.]RWH73511.1 MAG: cytochrome B [Mesorhizobium sp.]RWL31362.1 MAG: cytochrome B [Mesorhizobium sp.]RWL36577.1 MAG: cytochrome B [Mesorhizobium sp.]RWL40663.1 MAG: cytochrome B [Mesorhizobium sp.]RWL58728.1 MAG: cytochrome B [Mesorhizobium sp.]
MTINDFASTRSGSQDTAERRVLVWDPLVRLFHWGLVSAFATAWLTAEDIQPVHQLAGYAVASLVGFRILWGLVGSRYARFAQFVRGPVRTASYIKKMVTGRERRYLGHNPAGAAMVVAILVTLSGTALTGWLLEAPDAAAGQVQIVTPAFAENDANEAEAGTGVNLEERAGGPLKDIHETLADLMLLLVVLHVGGVALASLRHRENLVRAMLTGRKRPPAPGDIA